jgi:hypothetical protein
MMENERWEERLDAQIKWDVLFETRKWMTKIPYLKFPSDVEVKVIPPFGGAMARFVVKKGKRGVSCYLDCYGHLGAMDEPYWEIYPYKNDTYRCYLNETDELMEKIVEELNREDENETNNFF